MSAAQVTLTKQSGAVVLRADVGSVVLNKGVNAGKLVIASVVLSGGSSSVDATTGDLILAVAASGGNDSQPIYASGDHSAKPFATIGGALASVPAHNDFGVTVNIAPGTFAPYTLKGFSGNGSIRLIGSTQAASVASGATSGQCGAGTSVDQDTGLITIAKPTGATDWTAGDLRGRLFVVTGGDGAPTEGGSTSCAMIVSNTTTQAIARYGVATGDPLNDFSWTSIDTTTNFEIVDPATIVTGAPLDDSWVMGLDSIANLVSHETLSFADGGAPTEYGGVFRVQTCAWAQWLACWFNTSGIDHCDAIDPSYGVDVFVFISNYVTGNSDPGLVFNAYSCGGVFAYGNVVDQSGAMIAQNCGTVDSASNDLKNMVHADGNGWEAYGCKLFVDAFSSMDTLSGSAYILGGCAQAQLTSNTATSVAGYGIQIQQLTSVEGYSNSLSAPTDLLLDDTDVALSSLSVGDVAACSSALFTYGSA